MSAELAVYNALISQSSNRRVASCLKEGLSCGLTAGAGATVGFLIGGPIGCAIGGLIGTTWASTSAKGPSLIQVLKDLDPHQRDEVIWSLVEALKQAAIIKASTSMGTLAQIISKGEQLEQIFKVLAEVLRQQASK